MATIGPGFGGVNFYANQPLTAGQFGGPASSCGCSGGPQGMGQGRQIMSDLEMLLMLVSLLSPGAQAPNGASAAAGPNGAIAAAGGKGGGARAMAGAGGKGGGALRRANAKGAQAPRALAKAGGK